VFRATNRVQTRVRVKVAHDVVDAVVHVVPSMCRWLAIFEAVPAVASSSSRNSGGERWPCLLGTKNRSAKKAAIVEEAPGAAVGLAPRAAASESGGLRRGDGGQGGGDRRRRVPKVAYARPLKGARCSLARGRCTNG
jgi:hypothetical protein